MTFKVGDKVRRIDNICNEWPARYYVVESSPMKNWYYFEGKSGAGYGLNFELVKEPEVTPKLDLTASKLDLTKPVQTRDGRPVRILCTDAGKIKPVVGLIKTPTGDMVFSWSPSGRRYTIVKTGHRTDLINVPEKPKEVVANLAMTKEGHLFLARKCDTFETLFARTGKKFIAFKSVTLKEGDGM